MSSFILTPYSELVAQSAGVAELADARDSNSRGEILVGSIPTSGTHYNIFHDVVLGRVLFRPPISVGPPQYGAAFNFESNVQGSSSAFGSQQQKIIVIIYR